MNRAIDDSCSNAALAVTPLQSNFHASLSLLLSTIALRPRLWLLVLEHVSTALWPLDLVINLLVLSGVQEACGGHRSQGRVLPRAPERWTLAALMMSAPTLTESQSHSCCSVSDAPGGSRWYDAHAAPGPSNGCCFSFVYRVFSVPRSEMLRYPHVCQ